METMPIVVITSCHRWSYFNWFLLGLYELERKKKIKLRFKTSFSSKVLRKIHNEKLCLLFQMLFMEKEEDSYNLNGYVQIGNKMKFFSIDSADSPFLFCENDLIKDTIYFKMQCPIDLDKEGFMLTEDICIPWLDHAHKESKITSLTALGERRIIDLEKYKGKIRPLMVGPRYLSRGLSYRNLKKGFDNYQTNATAKKEKRIMCYFGNAFGPKPIESVPVDYDNEANLLGFFGCKINHPNEKRAKVSEMLNGMDNCDSRLISTSNSDNGLKENKELIIPMREFCAHIAKFQYNVNITGYRFSIPNRFIESFMVGTAIFTDKLKVRWYLPFDDEVVESIELGYKQNDSIEWNKYLELLNSLPEANADLVLNAFERKWSPEVVAEYIVSTVVEVE